MCLPFEMDYEETAKDNKQDKTILNNPLTISLPAGNNSSLQKVSDDVGKGEETPLSITYIPGEIKKPERRKRSRDASESELDEGDDKRKQKITNNQELQDLAS